MNRSSLRALWSSSPPGWGLSPGMKTWAAIQPSIFYLDDSQENWACTLYRPTAEGLEKLGDVSGLGNLMDLDFTGSYLSGRFWRIYRPGDGYYDVNLATGQGDEGPGFPAGGRLGLAADRAVRRGVHPPVPSSGPPEGPGGPGASYDPV